MQPHLFDYLCICLHISIFCTFMYIVFLNRFNWIKISPTSNFVSTLILHFSFFKLQNEMIEFFIFYLRCPELYCPSGWTPYFGHTLSTCINVSGHNTEKAWLSARDACQAEQAELYRTATSEFLWKDSYFITPITQTALFSWSNRNHSHRQK